MPRWPHVDSGDHPAMSGRDLLADLDAGGSISSVKTTTTLHLQTSGGVRSDAATVERRYGPHSPRHDDEWMYLRHIWFMDRHWPYKGHRGHQFTLLTLQSTKVDVCAEGQCRQRRHWGIEGREQQLRRNRILIWWLGQIPCSTEHISRSRPLISVHKVIQIQNNWKVRASSLGVNTGQSLLYYTPKGTRKGCEWAFLSDIRKLVKS